MVDFRSARYEGEAHIDEYAAREIEERIKRDQYPEARGYSPRDFAVAPVGFCAAAPEFDLPIIPRSEWQGRIEQMEKEKSNLSSIAQAAGILALSQDRTLYCWVNAVCQAVQVVRAFQNEPNVLLSPASVGFPIKRRNTGGWGIEAVEYSVPNGFAPVSLWPANGLSMQYDTPECREARKQYRILEWFDLQPRNFEQLATCLLNRMPVAVGYNWWGHEVLAMDLIYLGNGRFGIRILNSWGTSWGANGYGTLEENRARPDDAQAVRQANATGGSRAAHFATAL